MKLISLLAVASGLLGIAYAIDLKIVAEDIVPNCLNRLYDPKRPLQGAIRPQANSIENFVSLVERIERNHTNWDIYKVSKILLKRFGFDGIVFTSPTGERIPTQNKVEDHYATRTEIIDTILPFRRDEIDVFDEKDLSEEEKCSMFLMLGHLVNDTYVEGEDIEALPANYNAGDPHSHSHSDSGQISDHKRTNRPREQGVVSLNGNQHHSIALGKVLLGIIASERSADSLDIGQYFEYLKLKFPEPFAKNLKINPLLGVTLGDVVAHAALSKGHSSEPYGVGGEWNSTACTEVFRMNKHTQGSTRALIMGAIDGLLIGKRLAGLNGGRKPSLSKTLRMYYSRQGIPTENSGSPTTYCRRNEFRSVIGDNGLIESIAAYYLVYYSEDFRQPELHPEQKATENLGQLDIIVSQMIHNYDYCNIQTTDQIKCETRSNLFFVLDDSEARSRGLTQQEQVIALLSSNFDIGYGESTVGIFHNTRGGNNNLRPVDQYRTFNSTNQASATCAASRIDSNNIPQSIDEESLMHALNGTLQDFELVTSLNTYAPSKVVVIFKYSEFTQKDLKRVDRAANIVRYGHRDTRVFAVGDNEEELKTIATSVADVIKGVEDPKRIAEQLATKVCEVPSVLQYEDCWNRRNRNEQSNVYKGFSTPNHVQYLAMYPQYFLKSSRVQFKFNAEGTSGDITVCFSRSDRTPREGEKGIECKTSGTDGIREVIFGMTDPCHKYQVYNCPPAFFSITGIKKSMDRNRCVEEDCRRLDQIKYTVTHEGVYCSGCLNLLSSPITMFVLIAAVFRKVLW